MRNKTREAVKRNSNRPAQKSGGVEINNDKRRIATRSLKSKPHKGKTLKDLLEVEAETPAETDGDATLDLNVQPMDCSKDATKPNTRCSREKEKRIGKAMKLRKELLSCSECRKQESFIKKGTYFTETQILKHKMCR